MTNQSTSTRKSFRIGAVALFGFIACWHFDAGIGWFIFGFVCLLIDQ